MRNIDSFSKFVTKGDFRDKKISAAQVSLQMTNKQMIRRTFRYLGQEIAIIQDNEWFHNAINNAVTLLTILCDNENFTEEEVIINRKRIKKMREALLASANKLGCLSFLDAANKLDEIILDKNIDYEDLLVLLRKLIDKKEDINIIKKLLNTNKGVLIINKNLLFDYIFELALDALVNDSPDIYYYITLLKIFYSSNIDVKEYVERLDAVSNEKNPYANEIYSIIHGVKRSLKPEEIVDKYGLYTSLPTPTIIIPGKETTNEKIITIDGIRTQLRDDGISIDKDGNKFFVGVHITDPTSIVLPGSGEEKYARNNFKNIAVGRDKFRIFSPQVENAISLNAGQNKQVISMYAYINNDGTIHDYRFTTNVIKPVANISYMDADHYIDEGYDTRYTEKLRLLYEVACLLEEQNKGKQAYWDKKNNDIIEEKEIIVSKSDKIISELMILYNRLIAMLACDESFPYTFRIQDKSYIGDLVRKQNIKLDDANKKVIESIYLDSKYCAYPRYHHGLDLPIYSQSTDPARKYPDFYNMQLFHQFYLKDLDIGFDYQEHLRMIEYFNQRNIELQLFRSEYGRALKLERVKNN